MSRPFLVLAATALVAFAATRTSAAAPAEAAPFGAPPIGARSVDEAHASGPCADFGKVRQICDLGSPEDIAALPGSSWLLVSQQNPPAEESGFVALNSQTLALVRIKLSSIVVAPNIDCAEPPKTFSLGGIGVRRRGSDYELVAINHGASEAVERFRVNVDQAGPHLTWTACVGAPSPYFLNDIAALPEGAFAATHMFDRAVAAANPQAQRARLLAGEVTGFVVHWSPSMGWAKVANSEGSFPNGIDASPDGRTLYFAETYGHAVNAIGVDGSNRRRLAVAMQPDNVTVADGGVVIVAGGTGVPLTSTAGCAAFRAQGCGFASAIDKLDFQSGTTRRLFADDGAHMPGASVGVMVGRWVYIGTSFGDRITVAPTAAR